MVKCASIMLLLRLLLVLLVCSLKNVVVTASRSHAGRHSFLRAPASILYNIDDCSSECCSDLWWTGGDLHSYVSTEDADAEVRGRVLQVECGTDDGGSWISAIPAAVQYIIIILLVVMSGIFSGLTLGLMSLDKHGLEIVMEGDNPRLARAAARIYPVRENGNLLLCTLLLGNVSVNALLSILLADKAGGLLGFFVSTFVIVIFGEILPQAACSRYALEVGSFTLPLTKVIICLFYPLAAPLAFLLNKMLGHEIGTTYSKAEMLKLLEIHVTAGRFDSETGNTMTGALKYQDMTVKEVMTPTSNVFMISVDDKLNFETIATIFKTGYSRIPVYEVAINNIIGLLFVKDLIFIDPEDETSVRSFVQIFGRGVHVVWPDDKLGDVLRELKQGKSHMALVRDVNRGSEEQDPYYEIKGIITLEDIIEVILGDEIVDETDAFVDQIQSIKVNRDEVFDWGRLRLLDAKLVDETLSHDEVKAVSAHLRMNHKTAVELLSEHQLRRLVAETSVTELPEAELNMGDLLPTADLIYVKETPSDICTLILSGKVTIMAGAENFRSDVSSWAVLAPSALIDPCYTPDFNAFVSSGPCRCLRFTRARFSAAVDASTAERFSDVPNNNTIRDTSNSNYPNGILSTSDSSIATTTITNAIGNPPNLTVAGVEEGDSQHSPTTAASTSHTELVIPGVAVKKRGAHARKRSKLLAAFQKTKSVGKLPAAIGELTSHAENGDNKEGGFKESSSVSAVRGDNKEVGFQDEDEHHATVEMSPLQAQLSGNGVYQPGKDRTTTSKRSIKSQSSTQIIEDESTTPQSSQRSSTILFMEGKGQGLIPKDKNEDE